MPWITVSLILWKKMGTTSADSPPALPQDLPTYVCSIMAY